jgi:hypothetical protein
VRLSAQSPFVVQKGKLSGYSKLIHSPQSLANTAVYNPTSDGAGGFLSEAHPVPVLRSDSLQHRPTRRMLLLDGLLDDIGALLSPVR